MQQSSDQVKDYFHRRAVDFDSLYREDGWQYYANRLLRGGLYERVELTLAEFADMRDFTVLDVGCGSGRNSFLFAQAGARRVFGVDAAPNMLDLARQAAAEHDTANVCEFVHGDFVTYPFTEKFDVAVALGVFDYVNNPADWLRRMSELATRKVIISFPAVSLFRAPFRKLRYALRSCPVYFYTPQQLEQICKDLGLRDCIIPYPSRGLLLVCDMEPGA